MKQNKQIWIFALFLIILILLTNNVFALGIAPAKKEIDTSESIKTFDYYIVNNEEKSFTAQISFSEELEGFFETDDEQIKVSKDESMKKFEVEMKKTPLPGTTGYLILTEFISDEGMIQSQIVVKSKIIIKDEDIEMKTMTLTSEEEIAIQEALAKSGNKEDGNNNKNGSEEKIKYEEPPVVEDKPGFIKEDIKVQFKQINWGYVAIFILALSIIIMDFLWFKKYRKKKF